VDGGFQSQFQAGQLKANEVLSQYAAIVYQQCGTYEEAAKRMGVDRRTVKSWIAERASAPKR
jgi:DNA-directed RNA polymerase specialized sigma24 family protein